MKLNLKNISLVAVFLILIAVIWVIKNPRFFSSPSAKEGALLKSLDKDKVVSFEIKETSNPPKKLIKENGAWFLVLENKVSADNELVNQLLDTLFNLKRDELVSENKNKWSDFQLEYHDGSPSGVAVTLKNQDGDQTLLIGKPGPDYSTAYVRLAEEEKTYLAGKSLRSQVLPLDWRNLNLKIVDRGAVIKEMVFKYSAKSINLFQKDNKWLTDDGREAKKDSLDFMVGQLESLRAADLLDMDKIENPVLELLIKTDKGEANLIVGQKSEKGYPAKVGGREGAYLLSSPDFETFSQNSLEKSLEK